MKRVETVLEIAAPAARVWDVITDFGVYPDWNPVIPSIRGGTAVGDKVRFTIVIEGLPRLTLSARVSRMERLREFAWRGGPVGIFQGEHYFRLEPLGEDRTRLVHGETFSGVLPLWMDRFLGRIQRSYARLNKALADRATQPTGTPG